jgi:hypothetical protein
MTIALFFLLDWENMSGQPVLPRNPSRTGVLVAEIEALGCPRLTLDPRLVNNAGGLLIR